MPTKPSMSRNQDIDPEINFFNNLDNCNYVTVDQFNNSIKVEHSISIIHSNSRSLNKNFQDIVDYLKEFNGPFSVIAISETWIGDGRCEDYEIPGYELNHINRTGKAEGGTALYVHRRLKYTVVDRLTVAVENVCECITIEIDMNRNRNIMISCIYRAPSYDITTFKEWIEKVYVKTEQKVMFICGDFNIDLLNPNKQVVINDFTETIYAMSLYPIITKPSRITSHSATHHRQYIY